MEVERKKRLALQAIAARGQFKDIIQQQQLKLNNFNLVLDQIRAEKQEALNQRDRFEKKHDDMFGSVSGLNSRIEELEQHKLHLL